LDRTRHVPPSSYPRGILSTRYVVAVVSDVHAGGTTALCPESVPLDDGGEYRASKAQLWLMQCWQDYWADVAATRENEKAILIAVFNGDLVDGAHHKTTQILSENPNAQAAVVNAAMAIPLALKPDHLVIVRGTEAHVGQSGSAEERIADGLRRDKRPIITEPESKTASWWHWRAEIEGVRLDVTHHGRTGQREHTRGSAAILHAHDILLAHVKQNHLPPHLCLRGHYHKFNDSGDACPTRVVTTGAWQLGTSFVKKVAADSLADVGGAIVTIQDGAYDVRKVHFKPETRGPVWRPL
jgi:hypothetical protein